MNHALRHSLSVLALCLAAAQAHAVQVTVPEGTLVTVELRENINGNINTSGESIEFTVADDVLIDGEVVFAQGSPVSGFISAAEGRKSMGRSGELTFQMRHATAVDGTEVRLMRNDISMEGRQRTGATVAHTVIWGPLGLFAKGRAAFATKGTLYDIETDRDAVVETGVFIETTPPLAASRSVGTRISTSTGKFKFSKGKPGDNLELRVTDPEIIERVTANPDSATIVEIDGYRLPKPVPSLGVFAGYRKRGKETFELFEFDFWEVVKYTNPGTTGLTVRFDLGDGQYAESETRLELEWKMK